MMVSLGDGTSQIASVGPMTNDNATNNSFQSPRSVIPVVQEDSIRQSDNASQADTFSALLREAVSKFEEMRASTRKEIEDSTRKTQETVRLQELAFKELERKVEEQDRELKAQAAQRRLEHENAELRENLRNEREARMWDVICLQQLTVQESKRLVESMTHEQHELDARLRQERDESTREMDRRIQIIQEENAASVAQMQEMICAQKSAIQDLEKKTTRTQREQTKRQQAEHGQTERDIVELRDTLRNEREARAGEDTWREEKEKDMRHQAQVQVFASQELKSLIAVMNGEQRERDKDARDMERRLQGLQQDVVENETQIREAVRVLELAIDELKEGMQPIATANRVREGQRQDESSQNSFWETFMANTPNV